MRVSSQSDKPRVLQLTIKEYNKNLCFKSYLTCLYSILLHSDNMPAKLKSTKRVASDDDELVESSRPTKQARKGPATDKEGNTYWEVCT
jgi:hypothetical protein